ncbi:Sip1-related alpha-galactosidase [Cohnella caldifontis]|uniref:Sip1-related alpha-galactosidase n=1 Tax=Cohnella caldifontis TaxID=3027471 RepID=UPI0023ECF9D0|nr:Sip1-related alpha-galactosidase [Cohnella sp. YIM B05605]
MISYREEGLFHESEGRIGRIAEAFGLSVRLDPAAPPAALIPDGIERSAGTDRAGSYEEAVCRFRHAEEWVSARLILRFYGNVMLASVEAEARNDNAFGKQRCFAPEGGIVVTVSPAEPIEGLLALYQHKDWWTRPHFSTDPAALPGRTQSLLWRASSGYRYLLPAVGPVCRTEAAGSAEGFSLRVSTYQDGYTEIRTLAFALAAGQDPYGLVGDSVGAALKALDFPTLPREAKTYPEILDGLGWCSWDAFYHQVNEEGLLAKADELRKLGLPVRWVMIDDGWSEIRDGRLAAFDADPGKFPNGLAHTIRELKETHGIRHVGVWHTIAGYWGGIDPDSAIARETRDSLFQVPRGHLVPYPEAGRGFGFWNAWHGYLRRQGVDFVKVDSQSAVLNFFKGQRSIGEAASAAHTALEASVALHFDKTIINCMGMAAENIWHRPNSAVSRNSDDFVPQEKRGFPEHALQNAYNSFYHGAFYWGDWDMYWTRNHDDVQNAVLRSVSGGPVYVSDALEKTDPAKLWPLIYRDGSIIRCDGTPAPTEDCLLRNPAEEAVPLKIWNKAGASGAGVVAAFHIHTSPEPVEGGVGPRDVPGLAGKRFAVYEHFTRSLAFVGADERVPFRLPEGGYALYTIVPADGPVVPIGLAEKYVSSHAVLRLRQDGNRSVLKLREGGKFVFAADAAPVSVRCDGEEIRWEQAGGSLYEADCSGADGEATIEIELP